MLFRSGYGGLGVGISDSFLSEKVSAKSGELQLHALGARRVAVAGPRFDSEAVVDVEARVLPAGEDGNSIPDRKPSINEAQQRQQPGCFEPHEFSNGAGKRAYKVNLPAMKSEAPRAMVVMLHGCTVDRSKVGSCALCVTAEASIWMQDAGAKQV